MPQQDSFKKGDAAEQKHTIHEAEHAQQAEVRRQQDERIIESKLDKWVDGHKKLLQNDKQLLKSLEHAIIESDLKTLSKLIAIPDDKKPEDFARLAEYLTQDMKRVGLNVAMCTINDGDRGTYKNWVELAICLDTNVKHKGIVFNPFLNEGGVYVRTFDHKKPAEYKFTTQGTVLDLDTGSAKLDPRHEFGQIIERAISQKSNH